jgi:hypothetical protein
LKSEVNELKNQKELTSQTINELKEENAKLEMKNATITQDMQSRWPDFFCSRAKFENDFKYRAALFKISGNFC